ncbi:hypothetical protein ACOCJ4_09545 [Knoellia sp. CPCC 206435]|uniref:hypothetical protein n=1 Tax=Knoellia terrae TaxID=3404797 RepID=UPI003B4303AC
MTQTATARPLQRSASRPTRPQPLRVVREQQLHGQPGFVAACLALLVAGLIGVLMLNTAMAKGSFVLGDLQDTSNELADAEEALSHAINAQGAAPALAQRAIDMGMVPAETAAFLRLSDGRVLGVATGAAAQKEFKVATQGSSTAAASTPAAVPQTTVRTEGDVTTTTVSTVKGDTIEVTKTSVDARTGATSTTTSTRPAPATPSRAASPAPSGSTAADARTPAPQSSASAAASPRAGATPSATPSRTPNAASPSPSPTSTTAP